MVEPDRAAQVSPAGSAEQMAAGRPGPDPQVLAGLRDQVARLQGRPNLESIPVHQSLQGFIELRPGGVYGVDAASLALLLLAGPSGAGSWCGVVGVRDFGVEAAFAMGIDPARTVLVPDPGAQWLEVTAALVDVLALVVVRPPATVSSATAARIAARLRNRGSALVSLGPWPGMDAQLGVAEASWHGADQGFGHLRSRRLKVSLRPGAAPVRTRTLWLPASDQTVRMVEPESPLRDLIPDRSGDSSVGAAQVGSETSGVEESGFEKRSA